MGMAGSYTEYSNLKGIRMSKVLIVYSFTAGNTAALAEMIGEQLKAAGHTSEVQDASGVSPDNVCMGWDAVLLGRLRGEQMK